MVHRCQIAPAGVLLDGEQTAGPGGFAAIKVERRGGQRLEDPVPPRQQKGWPMKRQKSSLIKEGGLGDGP